MLYTCLACQKAWRLSCFDMLLTTRPSLNNTLQPSMLQASKTGVSRKLLTVCLKARTPPPLHPPQAVKAMRYGEGGGGAAKEFEDATALRERQEQELQAALEEDDDF